MIPKDLHDADDAPDREASAGGDPVEERLPGDGNDLEKVIVRRLDLYFARLEGRDPHPLYDLVVHAVERPLIDYAMSMCSNNQCAAAQLLGINRNTLRKKLQDHGMLSVRRISTKLKEK